MNPNSTEQKNKEAAQSSSRSARINQIDALYKSQIKKIYNETREAVKQGTKQYQQRRKQRYHSPKVTITDTLKTGSQSILPTSSQNNGIKKAVSSKNLMKSEFMKPEVKMSKQEFNNDIENKLNMLSIPSPNGNDQKVRASTFLQGESTRTIQILRRQNQTKQMKIRQLTNRCQNLIEKLRNHLPPHELQIQLDNVKKFSDRNMQRLQSLFKIKNQQIFFKIKLQITRLLQEFQVSKQQISGINQVNNETQLFQFMVRKLKFKLKDFRSKQQKSSLESQKDKIVNQKHEERIHYLTETIQLLKLSETKLKNKVQDLRGQLNEYIDKIKQKEKQIEEKQNQVFRLKKQNEDLQLVNKRITQSQRNINTEKTDEKRIYEAKQKQMKALLASYFMQKKQLQNLLQQKEGQIEQILIREKFLQGENERLNRQYVRWKERYEWIEKQKQNRQKQFEQEKNLLLSEFQGYKSQNNEGVYMSCKGQTDEAMKKVEEYQAAFQKIMSQLEQEKKYSVLKQQQYQKIYEQSQRDWVNKIKSIQRMKDEQINEIVSDHDTRERQLKDQFEKREELLASQIEAKMRAMIAESQKKATLKAIQLQTQKDDLIRENQSLKKLLQTKDNFISTMEGKKNQYSNY